jgi:hypothetical protein
MLPRETDGRAQTAAESLLAFCDRCRLCQVERSAQYGLAIFINGVGSVAPVGRCPDPETLRLLMRGPLETRLIVCDGPVNCSGGPRETRRRKKQIPVADAAHTAITKTVLDCAQIAVVCQIAR